MKKPNLLQEILLRIARVLAVIVLSDLLFHDLKDFVKKYSDALDVFFSIPFLSSIALLIILLAVVGLLLMLKRYLLGDDFDNKGYLVLTLYHALYILTLVIFTIHMREEFGENMALATPIVIEVLSFFNDFFTEDSETEETSIE